VGRYLITNLQEIRRVRGLTYKELSARLEKLGRPIPTLGLSRIEKGTRRVDTDDLAALALALGVSPASLMLPRTETEDEPVQLTEELEVSAKYAWAWADSRGAIDVPGVAEGREDFRPWWLTRGVLRESQLPEMERQLAEQQRQLDLVKSAMFAMQEGREPGAPAAALQPVVAAIVTSGLGVLIGKRNDGAPPWTFIAGEVEPGEQPADAAVREVKEETGLEVEAGAVIGERVHPKTQRTMIYMAARTVRGTDVFVGDHVELAEVRWVGLAEADELLPGMFGPVREYLARELAGGAQ
jgi:8-oxo-dGTP pyrophosphatase MutT (NUDIX family)